MNDFIKLDRFRIDFKLPVDLVQKSVDGTAVRLLRRRMACRKDDLILLIENFDIKLRAQDVHDIFQIIDADRSEQKICCSPFAVKDRSKNIQLQPVRHCMYIVCDHGFL